MSFNSMSTGLGVCLYILAFVCRHVDMSTCHVISHVYTTRTTTPNNYGSNFTRRYSRTDSEPTPNRLRTDSTMTIKV